MPEPRLELKRWKVVYTKWGCIFSSVLCPCCFNTCSFPLFCPDTEQPILFQQPCLRYLYFTKTEEASSDPIFWVKAIFSQVTVFCQISSGNPGDLLPLADISRLGLHPAIFSCTGSLVSLACWTVVDVSLILCNLDVILYKTTQDFGVLWNKIIYSTDFLLSSLWPMKYLLIWQCWSAAVLPADLGQQAAHESSRCFSCLGQWKPYGPFFLHLLPVANVSTADNWMCAM